MSAWREASKQGECAVPMPTLKEGPNFLVVDKADNENEARLRSMTEIDAQASFQRVVPFSEGCSYTLLRGRKLPLSRFESRTDGCQGVFADLSI